MKKIFAIAIALIMVLSLLPASVFAAEPDVTITTTFEDGLLLKGSKKTFDVFARDSEGNKVASTVTLNGTENVRVNWDDAEKTSFTLELDESYAGENELLIEAGDASLTLHFTYEPAEPGEVIGQAVFCIELFTLGCGYLIEPCFVDIIEGENSAQLLNRILEENGYGLDYTGSLESGFYLSGIESGTSSLADIVADVPDWLVAVLEENYFSIDEDRYDPDWLGEFDYTYGSGWMYTCNNVFPNVGYADYYCGDGDVIRTQFTLAYGSELGGGWGSPYYEVYNRDSLTTLIAKTLRDGKDTTPELAAALENAMEVCAILNAPEEDVVDAYNTLNEAYSIAFCEHENTEWHVTKEAEVGVPGEKEQVCTYCHKVLDTKPVDALECPHEHTEWKTVKEATTEEEGLKQLVCKDCEEVLDEEVISKITDNPDTGDSSMVLVCTVLMMASAVAVVLLGSKKFSFKG